MTNFQKFCREILAAEIAKNGVIPNSVRKAELAQELGLEYKTVRVRGSYSEFFEVSYQMSDSGQSYLFQV